MQTENKERNLTLLIVLLLTSVDTIVFGTNGDRTYLYVPRIIGLLSIVYMIAIIGRFKLRIGISTIWMLILLMITIVSGLYNGTETFTIISRAIPIVVAYCIAEYYSLQDFIDALDRIMFPLSCVAIVLYAITAFTPSVIRAFPTFYNENNIAVYTIGVGSVLNQVINGPLSRMSSIFWEPGAYAIYLCINIMFQVFYKETTNVKKIILYIICLITTFSTTGIIALIAIGLAVLLKRGSDNKNIKLLVVSVMILGLLTLFSTDDSILYNVFFSKITNRTGTASVRYSSLINGFQIAFDHPLLGVGGRSSEFMMEYAMRTGYGFNTMITNTFTHQFANYGFVFGLAFLFYSFKFFWNNRSFSRFLAIMLFVDLMIMYVGECFFSFLPFIFVFYGVRGTNVYEEAM